MKSLYPTIRKLLTAINRKNYLMVVNRKMIYSEKLDRMCTLIELNQLIQIDAYYKKYPNKQRKISDNSKYKTDKIMSSFKEIDILKKLIEIWNTIKDGENKNGEAARTETCEKTNNEAEAKKARKNRDKADSEDDTSRSGKRTNSRTATRRTKKATAKKKEEKKNDSKTTEDKRVDQKAAAVC